MLQERPHISPSKEGKAVDSGLLDPAQNRKDSGWQTWRPGKLRAHAAWRMAIGLFAFLVLPVISDSFLQRSLVAESPDETVIEGRREDPDLPTLSVLMEWTSVKIAEGYVLQIADEQGRLLVDEKGLKEPQANISLKPGRYQRRIGIVNKFGKLSFWSPWENFRLVQAKEPRIEQLAVQDHTPGVSTRVIVSGKNLDEFTDFKANAGGREVKVWRKEVLSGNRVAIDLDTSTVGDDAKIDIEAANPGKDPDKIESALVIDDNEASVNQPSAMRDFELGSYSWLIPGYNQFQRGESWKGYLISGGILFFSAASVYYAQEANALAAATSGDPLQQFFANPVLYSATIPSLPESTVSGLRVQSYNSYNSSVSKYNAAKNASYTAAGIAALIYGYHLWDVYYNATPDGVALFAEPRSLNLEPSAHGNLALPASAFRPSHYSPEQRRLTETYMGAGYRISF